MAGVYPAGYRPRSNTIMSGSYPESEPAKILEKPKRDAEAVAAYMAWRESVGLRRVDPYVAKNRMGDDKAYKKYLALVRKQNKARLKEAKAADALERKYQREDAKEQRRNSRADKKAVQSRAIKIIEDWDAFKGNPPEGYGESMSPEAAMRHAYKRATDEQKLLREATGETAMMSRDGSAGGDRSDQPEQVTTERPPGKVVKGKKGEVILSPTGGVMNGEPVYDVYKRKAGSDSWDKKGMSVGEGSTGFIPENQMGTSKMRMDTFKSAYNKYKRDMDIIGGKGQPGFKNVESRMKKDWGSDWKKTYLKDGKVQQMYWKDGKPTNVPPGEKVVEVAVKPTDAPVEQGRAPMDSQMMDEYPPDPMAGIFGMPKDSESPGGGLGWSLDKEPMRTGSIVPENWDNPDTPPMQHADERESPELNEQVDEPREDLAENKLRKDRARQDDYIKRLWGKMAPTAQRQRDVYDKLPNMVPEDAPTELMPEVIRAEPGSEPMDKESVYSRSPMFPSGGIQPRPEIGPAVSGFEDVPLAPRKNAWDDAKTATDMNLEQAQLDFISEFGYRPSSGEINDYIEWRTKGQFDDSMALTSPDYME